MSGFESSFEFRNRVQSALAAVTQQTEYSLVVDAINHSVTHREEVRTVVFDNSYEFFDQSPNFDYER